MDRLFDSDPATSSSRTPMIVVGMAVVVISCTLVPILFVWVNRRTSSLKASSKSSNALIGSRLPPGPRGWPILGSILQLGPLPHKSLHALSLQYGPLMFMRLGSVPTLVISSSEMAKHVLKLHDQNLASRPPTIVPTYLTYGRQDIAFAPYGAHWRKVRKICTLQLLTTARMQHFQTKREREVRAMLYSILEESRKRNSMKVSHFLVNLTMNIVTQMMWNKRYRGLHESSISADEKYETTQFTNIIREYMDLGKATNIADFVPVLKPLVMNLQGFNKRMKAIRQKVDVFLGDIISEHQKASSRVSSSTVTESFGQSEALENKGEADDFVDVLLKISNSKDDGSKEALPIDTVKAIVLDMLAAGADTSAATLEWALAELLRNPHVMKKAQDELYSVVGPERLVTEDDIPSLKYLQAVVKESLRLHMPAPLGVPHLSIEDCTIAGFHVPAETLLFFNYHAIHKDPATWERPLEFDPERFLGSRSSIDFKGQDFELLPFGSGRRMCPGMNLANAVLHIALAQLLHVFNLSFAGDGKPEDIDMTEVYEGIVCTKADPLIVSAQLRLQDDVLCPDSS